MKLYRAAIAAALGLLVFAPGRAEAFVIKHTSTGAAVRWSARRVAWVIDPSVDELPGAADAGKLAADQWSNQEGAPRLVVGRGSKRRAPGYDGTSGIIFAPGGFAPAGRALAVTIVSFDDRTGAILDADVVVNGKYRFERVTRETSKGNAAEEGVELDDRDTDADHVYDVARVLAHETGHALGLGDSPGEREAVMYPFVAPSTVARTAPSADDLAGLDALYDTTTGAGIDHQGCSSVASNGGAGVRDGGFAAAAAIAIVAGARRGRSARAAGAIALALVVQPMGVVSREPASTSSRATVTSVETIDEGGLFRSTLTLTSNECRTARCPEVVTMTAWGGVVDGVRQEIAGRPLPRVGDRVEMPSR